MPVEISYRSRLAIREAIAYGLEQSIRILPSQSRVMNGQAGSTAGLITVRSMPSRSAMYCQYWTEAPPSGSAPMWTPASAIASRLRALRRSSQ